MTRFRFMNTEIDSLSMDEVIREIEKLVIENRNVHIVTPNVDHIVRLENDKEFQNVYKNAELILADGMPLMWISRIYKMPIKEKISGSDLFPLICKMASKKGYSMYFLGAGNGVAERAAINLVNKYPGLQVVGTYSPPYDFENNNVEINKIIEKVKKQKPHILIVGLGTPKQEKFILKYKQHMGVPISLGLGASLDFEAGNIKRAPKWMSDAGLEWFYRLSKEPKRMFKRYLIDDMKIIRLIWKYKQK